MYEDIAQIVRDEVKGCMRIWESLKVKGVAVLLSVRARGDVLKMKYCDVVSSVSS